jgi:hypothetical protein
MADTFNPILQSRELNPLSPSSPSASPAPGKAIALAGKGQSLLVIRYGDGRTLTRGQLMLGRYNWFYEIDMTEQQLNFDESLQSRDNIAAFRASVSLACNVRDPAMIVEHNITDALGAIRPAVVEAMRDVAIRYGIEQIEQVRQEMRRISLAKTHGGFLISRFSFNLALTKEAEKLASERVLQRLQHQNKLEQAGYDDEIKEERARRARRLIQEGVESLLAEHLANNPNDTINVAKMLYEQRRKEQELLKIADSIEDPHIRDLMIEKLTGKPIAELTSGSDVKDESSDSDYEIVMADDDDLPEEFRRH